MGRKFSGLAKVAAGAYDTTLDLAGMQVKTHLDVLISWFLGPCKGWLTNPPGPSSRMWCNHEAPVVSEHDHEYEDDVTEMNGCYEYMLRKIGNVYMALICEILLIFGKKILSRISEFRMAAKDASATAA